MTPKCKIKKVLKSKNHRSSLKDQKEKQSSRTIKMTKFHNLVVMKHNPNL